MIKVSLLTFLYKLFACLSLSSTLKYFGSNYSINCIFFNIHVINDGEIQKQILKSSPKLMFLNSIFHSSHGFRYGIDSVNDTDKLWEIIHLSVKESISEIM